MGWEKTQGVESRKQVGIGDEYTLGLVAKYKFTGKPTKPDLNPPIELTVYYRFFPTRHHSKRNCYAIVKSQDLKGYEQVSACFQKFNQDQFNTHRIDQKLCIGGASSACESMIMDITDEEGLEHFFAFIAEHYAPLDTIERLEICKHFDMESKILVEKESKRESLIVSPPPLILSDGGCGSGKMNTLPPKNSPPAVSEVSESTYHYYV